MAENLKEIIKSEYAKCMHDPVYFIKKYCWIQHPQRGRMKFNLYPFQERMIPQFVKHNRVIILKSRQLGISTLSAAYSLWLTLFFRDKNVLVIATKQKVASNMITKVREMYKNLPTWMRAQMLPEKNNSLSVRFNNGSQIAAESSTGDVGRSEAVSLLIIDEAAHIANFEEKWGAVQQTLATGGSCIALSTPLGMGNWFHKTWTGAEIGDNEFFPIKLHWTVHPERDQAWRDAQDEELTPKIAAQECDVDFLSSGHTVVEGDILIFYKDTYIRDPIEKRGVDKGFWIWEHPDYTKKYMVVADVARGDGSDYSAFHVFDIETLHQVAEYKGRIGTKEYGHFLVNVATEFNEALLVIENANIGWAVLQVAIDREYRNLYYSHKQMDYRIQDVDTFVSKGYDLKDKRDMVPGFTTSTATRPLIVSKMELYMRERAVEIYSQRLWDELSVFIWLGNGRPEAQYGYNDDLVLAFSIAMWVRDTAIRLQVEGQQMTRNALDSLGSSIAPGGIYTNKEEKHESWTLNYGKGKMDLTEWI